MEVAIVGAGAIGHMIAAYASLGGYQPILFGRQGAVKSSSSVKIGSQEITINSPQEFEKPLAVFFAVKSYQLSQSLQQYSQLFPDIPHILVSNGWYDHGVPELDQVKQLRKGFTNIGVSRTQRGYEVFNSGGCLYWESSPRPSVEETNFALNLKENGFGIREDVPRLRQEKWLFNSVINTMCAVHKLNQNGQLKHHQQAFDALLAECYQFAQEYLNPWGRTKEDLLSQAWQLVEKTAHNSNSMYVDVTTRKLTENQFLAGLILKYPERGDDFPKLFHYAREVDKLDRSITISSS